MTPQARATAVAGRPFGDPSRLLPVTRVFREDMSASLYTWRCRRRLGGITGDTLGAADSKKQAVKEAGPYTLYFFHTLFSHGNLANVGGQRQSGYVREEGLGWLRPENRESFLRTLQGFRQTTMDDLRRNERLCWGSPAEVRDQLIGLGEALGSNVLLVQFNQGAMPHDMFMNQIRRFAADVLPAVQRHQVKAPLR